MMLEPECDRVLAQLERQFVHRAFEGEGRRVRIGTAHIARILRIQPDVGGGTEIIGDAVHLRHVLVIVGAELTASGRLVIDIVSDRADPARGVRAELDPVPAFRAEGRVVEHLAARHDHFHGATEQHRGARDQRGLALDRALLAKSTADLRALDHDLLGIEPQVAHEHALDEVRALRPLVHGEHAALPVRGGRQQFHRIVVLRRAYILGLVAHRRTCHFRDGIARYDVLGAFVSDAGRIDDRSKFDAFINRADRLGAFDRGFDRLRYDQRDRLTPIGDVGDDHRWRRSCPRNRRRRRWEVGRGQNAHHPRNAHRRVDRHGGDPSLGDRGGNLHRVEHVADREVGAVFRRAQHFFAGIDTGAIWEKGVAQAGILPAAIMRASATVRAPSSIL